MILLQFRCESVGTYKVRAVRKGDVCDEMLCCAEVHVAIWSVV